MATDEYYLRQAEVTAGMAAAESDPERAEALHVLALKYFDKAERARAGRITPAYQIPSVAKDRDLREVTIRGSDDPLIGGYRLCDNRDHRRALRVPCS